MVTVLGNDAIRTARPRNNIARVLRYGVLALIFFYVVAPLYAGTQFALQNNAGQFSWSSVTTIPHQLGFMPAFVLSSKLAVVTVVGVLLLVVPTMIFVHLRIPRIKPLIEVISLLPIIFPPIILILGFMHTAPAGLIVWPFHLAPLYVVFSLPFVVRSLEGGLSALDLKTLVEAGRSLGANLVTILWRILLPNLTSALVSSIALVVAFVYSEFTMASFQQRPTVAVWIAQFSLSSGHITTAAALLSLIGAWVLLAIVLLADLARSRLRMRKVRFS